MISKREMKDRVYENIVTIGRAIASAKRLEILALLTQGGKSVENLAEQTDLSVKLTSAHLKVLKASRLVVSQRNGKRIFYRVADCEVAAFWVNLRTLAEQRSSEIQDALEAYFHDRQSMAQLDRSALLKRTMEGDVILLDVRPGDEYLAGHIPQAISIPIEELKQKLSTIPRDCEVIAYCRGPYCVFSHQAVETLRQSGYKAQRLPDGVCEWLASGLPVERGLAQ